MRKELEGFDFKAPSYTFNQDDFKAMAVALRADPLDDQHRAEFQRLCDHYLPFSASWEKAPHPNEVRTILEEVRDNVKRLSKKLISLHDHSSPDNAAKQSVLVMLHSVVPDNDWNDPDHDYDDMFAFIGRLEEIGRAATVALDGCSRNRAGPPGDQPFDTLGNHLYDLYTEIVGKRPSVTTAPARDIANEFMGKFLDFVEAFLRPLPLPNHKNRRELGLKLKRICSDRKRS